MAKFIVALTVEPEYRLRLTYADGEDVVADFAPVIAQGGVFRALADPATFAQAAIGAHGRFVAWPGEIDFCADALWEDAKGWEKL